MDQNDHDMQGTEGSGSLGGLDVRRRIPIKLLSKQTVRSKPVTRSQRPTGRQVATSQSGEEDGHSYKKDERFDCGAKAGDVFATQRRYPQPMYWDYKLNLLGEKDETAVHFCDKCGLPIKTYGRMIPCKHVFCYDCAVLHEKKGDKMCPGLVIYSCTDPVQRIEQCQRGSLYMCSVVQGCKRTYLSQRDLQAHVNHRHMRAGKLTGGRSESLHHPPPSDVSDRFRLPPPLLPKPHVMMPSSMGHGGHDPYGQPPPPTSHDDLRGGQPPPSPADLGPTRSMAQETFRIATVTTRKHSNLITVPIQDDSTGPGSGRENLPQSGPGPAQPGLHHPGDYGSQPVVSHPHHMMAPPPQSHYGPPPPPPPINPLSLQHPPQGSGTPTWGCTTRHHHHPCLLHPHQSPLPRDT